MNYKNNPFNIRYSKHNKWFGQIKPKDGFCQFESLYYGIRACIIIMTVYINKGFDTVEKIIKRFAPPSENDTTNYIKSVCKISCLSPSDKINSIHSYVFYSLLSAMAKIESNTSLDILDVDLVISHFDLPDVQRRV